MILNEKKSVSSTPRGEISKPLDSTLEVFCAKTMKREVWKKWGS